jgi:hypothetical protein
MKLKLHFLKFSVQSRRNHGPGVFDAMRLPTPYGPPDQPVLIRYTFELYSSILLPSISAYMLAASEGTARRNTLRTLSAVL